ncbi:WASH complex subunit 3-like isoform X2 [Papaver somniferum]|uniref:WASH complex subunit 3-like isoform X2 n=2 Tax=Papaver somniferum TaxID=3469 RepID=UPI000E6F473B|nr:WASH complex subunit 3-like isoform X2 [Papaver somniferum]
MGSEGVREMQRRSEWREEEGGVEVEESIISASDQRTLYLVNIFIVQTARFLNRFSFLCEDKLSTFHRRISRLDASLTLLETQLRSIIEDEEGKESSARIGT